MDRAGARPVPQLGHARDPDLAMGWRLLAATGMRRGGALALRWRDVDLDAGRLAVRRSVGVVKAKGAGEAPRRGADQDRPVPGRRPRRGHRRRAACLPGRPWSAGPVPRARLGPLVLSNPDGTHRHPERFSRRFAGQVAQARKALGEEQLPLLRLHDLRHTHATLLLADGVPVKVVSERLGHASATITLTVYQHVHPGMGREAADRFAALLEG